MQGAGSSLSEGMDLRMFRFAVMLGETKGESFQLSPPPLLLCTGRKVLPSLQDFCCFNELLYGNG